MEKLNRVSGNDLRKSIQDTINTIELIMTGIHDVLGEMGALVKQIDRTTEKLENKLSKRLKRKEVRLDANQNQCDASNRAILPSNSKQTTPSPFMDFTYLELMNNCDVCDNEISKFTYNEKYPLWIQYDTWRTGNTTSDISFVSSGSDVVNTGSESNNNSWRSVEEYLQGHSRNKSSTNKDDDNICIKRIDICCNNVNDLSGKYCGVYEQLMEEQLESEYFSYEGSRSDIDKINVDFWDFKSFSTMSLSDELIVHYSRNLNSWIPVKMEGDVCVNACTGAN